MLKQVWIDLLANAVKFTHQRQIATLEISYQQIEISYQQIDNFTVYFVKDNGVDFDMRYSHRLFSVFQRLHHAEDCDGTGVGLAIVQRIIHRYGDRV